MVTEDIDPATLSYDDSDILRCTSFKYITSLQNELAYRDETALGSVMYLYKIYGVADCNGEDAVTQT